MAYVTIKLLYVRNRLIQSKLTCITLINVRNFSYVTYVGNQKFLQKYRLTTSNLDENLINIIEFHFQIIEIINCHSSILKIKTKEISILKTCILFSSTFTFSATNVFFIQSKKIRY